MTANIPLFGNSVFCFILFRRNWQQKSYKNLVVHSLTNPIINTKTIKLNNHDKRKIYQETI